MKVVDLFCGCGGFSLGFDYFSDDFELVYALDNWKIACDSYKANFPDVDVNCQSALDLRASEIPRADVMIGSPPCRDFSPAKMQNRKPDLSLVNWFLEVIEHHQPQFWLLENVPHLGKFLNMCKWKIFAMNDYGVPQIRRRLFAGVYNEPEKTPIKPVFPTLLSSESRWKSSSYIDKIQPRRNPRKLGLGASSSFRRLCLIPEAKMIQTFPLDYIVLGSLKEQYKQIGNAVPPLFAFRLAEALANPTQQILSVNRS